MDAFRDAIHSLGIQPEFFNYLIALVIVIGSLWAGKRLYSDFSHPIDEDEHFERPTLKLGKHDQ